MSDDPIDRLREHVEKHKHHQQAFFSTAGLTLLLEELDRLRLNLQDYHQMHDRERDLRMDAEKKVGSLKAQVERLLGKEGARLMKDLPAAMKRHHYHPSTMHMGDCSVCGNVVDHPNHLPPYGVGVMDECDEEETG